MAGQSVAVVGNGIIGHGIAEVFAGAGWRVTLIGRNAASPRGSGRQDRGEPSDVRSHGLVSEAQRAAALSRVTTTTRLEAAAGAELAIEAVPEDMALKRAIFGRLDTICGPDAVLASSSGHLVSELVGEVRGRDRVVAAHFWYPPQLIPLVEVCGGPETASVVVARTCEILRAVGKEPVMIDKEVPGFIGNRIQFAALREAWALWAAGVASAEAIDAVVRHSIGRRLGVTGPLESADVGGLDTMVAFARFLQPSLNAAPLPPPALDRLGRRPGIAACRAGRGVYDWSRRDGASLLGRVARS